MEIGCIDHRGVLNSGFNGPGSSKSRTCSAGVAVVGSDNMTVGRWRAWHIRDVDFMSSHEELPCKIEITIIKIAVPGDGNQ
jgi:hypothetical protein